MKPMSRTKSARIARRVLRKVSRVFHRLGDHEGGTKYQQMARKLY
jgi:hypothetical protein